MSNLKIKTVIFCAVLGSFASLSIDIYVPALTHIANDMQLTQFETQLIIGVFIFGFAVTQLFFGFLSDFYGRKTTLFYGLIIYCVASVLPLIVQNSIHILYMGRFFQGVGACGAVISSYAIIRDMCSGYESTKILSYLYTAMVIVSSLAPLLGGYMASYLHWKNNFIFLLILGLLALFITYNFLSQPRQTKKKLDFFISLKEGYPKILQSSRYLAYVLLGSIVFIILLTFITISPFLVINNYNIEPHVFGVLLAVNAAFLAIGNYLPSRLVSHIGNNKCIYYGTILMIVGAVMMLLISLVSESPLLSFLLPMFCCSLGIGIITPTSMAGALEFFPENSGQASACAVFIRFVLAMFISSIFSIITTNVIIIFAFSIVIGCFINLLILKWLH